MERHFGQSGLSPPARIAIWPAGETPVREVEKAVFCLKPTKKADVLRAARRRLLLFTPGGQFPNQAEKLREPDSNRRPRGYEPRELPGCSTPRCGLAGEEFPLAKFFVYTKTAKTVEGL